MIIKTPEGWTFKEFRRHPVTQVLRYAGYAGRPGRPSAAELDKLGLPAELRKTVADGCAAVAEINEGGEHQRAWEAAEDIACRVLSALPAEQRDPYHWRDEPALPDHPDELAALVPRT